MNRRVKDVWRGLSGAQWVGFKQGVKPLWSAARLERRAERVRSKPGV